MADRRAMRRALGARSNRKANTKRHRIGSGAWSETRPTPAQRLRVMLREEGA